MAVMKNPLTALDSTKMLVAPPASAWKLALATSVAGVAILLLRRRSADRVLLRCSQCGHRKPASAFTLKQARRPEKKRKCLACVARFDASARPPKPPKPPKLVAAAPPPAVAPPAAAEGLHDQPDDPLRVARKAETVLRGRTERVLLVLEDCADDLNHLAVLRTCEALGVLRV